MTQTRVLDSEIIPKGKCYIVCTEYDEQDFDREIAHICDVAVQRGAQRLYVSFQNTGECGHAEMRPLGMQAETAAHRGADECAVGMQKRETENDRQGFLAGAYAFEFYSDFYLLQKRLTQTSENGRGTVRIKPLRAETVELFCALYNEAFFYVPNALTLTPREACAMLRDERQEAGYLMQGGTPIGVFIIRNGGEHERLPEIAAICVRPELWGRGFGTHALEALETNLYDTGARSVQLVSAGANKRAHSLYCAKGYEMRQRLSRWYEAGRIPQDMVE